MSDRVYGILSNDNEGVWDGVVTGLVGVATEDQYQATIDMLASVRAGDFVMDSRRVVTDSAEIQMILEDNDVDVLITRFGEIVELVVYDMDDEEPECCPQLLYVVVGFDYDKDVR